MTKIANKTNAKIISIDEHIRQIVIDELEKRQQLTELVPVSKFCRDKNISRLTLWRAEKEGKIKLSRIGRKVFVNTGQFVT